jgi:hypothetical protein
MAVGADKHTALLVRGGVVLVAVVAEDVVTNINDVLIHG